MREKLGTWNITLENHRERGFFLFFIHIFHVFSFFSPQVWIIVNKMDLSIQYFRLCLVSKKFERKYKNIKYIKKKSKLKLNKVFLFVTLNLFYLH